MPLCPPFCPPLDPVPYCPWSSKGKKLKIFNFRPSTFHNSPPGQSLDPDIQKFLYSWVSSTTFILTTIFITHIKARDLDKKTWNFVSRKSRSPSKSKKWTFFNFRPSTFHNSPPGQSLDPDIQNFLYSWVSSTTFILTAIFIIHIKARDSDFKFEIFISRKARSSSKGKKWKMSIFNRQLFHNSPPGQSLDLDIHI